METGTEFSQSDFAFCKKNQERFFRPCAFSERPAQIRMGEYRETESHIISSHTCFLRYFR